MTFSALEFIMSRELRVLYGYKLLTFPVLISALLPIPILATLLLLITLIDEIPVLLTSISAYGAVAVPTLILPVT